MNTEVRISPGRAGRTEITLSMPSGKAGAVWNAIRGILPLAGLKVRQLDEEGEQLRTAEEVFPDASPAMALRGFRGKMEWTQRELAEKLGSSQNRISDMESGKRPISKAMAVRIGKIFAVSHKAFL